jgi:hypothetical protein
LDEGVGCGDQRGLISCERSGTRISRRVTGIPLGGVAKSYRNSCSILLKIANAFCSWPSSNSLQSLKHSLSISRLSSSGCQDFAARCLIANKPMSLIALISDDFKLSRNHEQSWIFCNRRRSIRSWQYPQSGTIFHRSPCPPAVRGIT